MPSDEDEKPGTQGRGQARRGPFDRFAERSSSIASSSAFFALCLVSVAVWLGGLLLGATDRFVNAAVGVMAALTLLIVVVLKNAELRAEKAIQLKLDAIAAALLEDKADDKSAHRPLEKAIGLDEKL